MKINKSTIQQNTCYKLIGKNDGEMAESFAVDGDESHKFKLLILIVLGRQLGQDAMILT
jgi:hypothetical protein